MFGRIFFDFGVLRFYADVVVLKGKRTSVDTSAFEEDVGSGFDFGAYLAPFRLQKSAKIGEKTSSKRVQILDRFWNRFFIDFWSVLGAKIGPCRGPFRARTASGGAGGRNSAQFCSPGPPPDFSSFCIFVEEGTAAPPGLFQGVSGGAPGRLRGACPWKKS